MRRRTALVTGGTSGIGRSLVRDLVADGYDVHFVGRDAARGRTLEAELQGAGSATFVPLDLGELRAVRAFARHFRGEVPQLDRLVCSAGVILPRETRTSEGLETTFAVLCHSVVVLCRELAPALEAAGGARVVTVSGRPRLVLGRTTDLDDLDSTKGYRGMRTALEAVHAKTVLTQVLAERLAPQGIDVNAFHPGPVRSDLGRHLPAVLRWPMQLGMRLWPTGTATGRHVCLAPELTGITGQLFADGQPTPLAFDRTYREQLWDGIERIAAGVLGESRA